MDRQDGQKHELIKGNVIGLALEVISELAARSLDFVLRLLILSILPIHVNNARQTFTR
jgi:hypothetical protein